MPRFVNIPLPVADIPRHAEVALQRIAPDHLKVVRIERILYWLMIAAALFAIGMWVPFVQTLSWRLGLAAFALLLLVYMQFTAYKAHINMGYALRTQDFIFRKGWLFEEMHVVPLKKIQHCKVKRGPLERKYQLATLRIYTAGGSGADISLGGLPADVADTLKDWLTGEAEKKNEATLTEPGHDTTHDTTLA